MIVTNEAFSPAHKVNLFFFSLMVFPCCANHRFLYHSATPALKYDKHILALGHWCARFSHSQILLHMLLKPGLTLVTFRITSRLLINYQELTLLLIANETFRMRVR